MVWKQVVTPVLLLGWAFFSSTSLTLIFSATAGNTCNYRQCVPMQTITDLAWLLMRVNTDHVQGTLVCRCRECGNPKLLIDCSFRAV